MRKFLARAYLWKVFYRGLSSLGKAGAIFLAGGGILFLADWVFSFALAPRRALWFFAVVVAGTSALLRMFDFRAWRPDVLARDAGRGWDPPDAFLNLWELARFSGGTDLTGEMVRRSAARILPGLSGWDLGRAMRPPLWARRTGLSLGLCALSLAVATLLPVGARGALARIFFPFGSDPWAMSLKVLPGDGRFPRGQVVPLRVTTGAERASLPELWVRTAGSPWEMRPLLADKPGEFRTAVQGLLDPFCYKVRFHGEWTPVFTLTPYSPPRFKSLQTEIIFPAYTGRPSEVLENALAFQALRGAQFRLQGVLEEPVTDAEIVFEDQRRLPARIKDGRTVTAGLEALASGDFRLVFKSPALPDAGDNAVSFHLDVTEDAAPSLQILAPGQDLLLSPREKLPLTYAASDDFGLARVFLNAQVGDGPIQKILLREFHENATGGTFDALWDLGALNLKGGERVRYFLSALDNNSLTGPGEGRSASFTLETASYESEHAVLEADLADLRKDLLSLMGDESLLAEEAKGAAPPWPSLAEKQAALRNKLDGRASRLEDLVKKMDRDPLTDQVMAAEYKAVLNNLRELGREALGRAQAALAAGQKEAASEALDEAVSELERLSLLSDDVVRAKRMRDLLSRQEDLTQDARNLTDQLEGLQGKPLSEDDRRKLAETLADASKLMEDIGRQLASLPRDLPEDFVNQEGVKTLRMDETRSLMGETQRALARGDAAGALASARKMLENLRDMQKVLQKAGRERPGGPDWFGGKLKEGLEENRKRLADLAGREEALETRTQALSAKALARVMEEQKGLMKQIAESSGAAKAALSERLKETSSEEAGALPEEKTQSVALAAEQEALRKDTLDLRRQVQVLARQTATLSTRLTRRLRLAAGAMEESGAHLAANRFRSAAGRQETALQYLRDSQDELQQAGQTMSGLAGAPGKPMTGSLQTLPGAGESAGGARTQPVRIPRADDYRPPPEFREEILKSMKEKYPKIYEKAIQDYYQNWAR